MTRAPLRNDDSLTPSNEPQNAFSGSKLNTKPTPIRLWSVAGIVAAWLILQIGGLFSPGLLDDVDSIYIQIAREMLQRHDFVTPTIDGIRFFDKPPLMYWMAAASMHLFGIHDYAARLPLALGVLTLLFAVYALGIRLFASLSPRQPDRAGLYAALAMATSIGPYLYTRFYIPDILIALWMTLAVHLFLIAVDRLQQRKFNNLQSNTLVPMLAFGAVLALSVLTKGLIGIVFPIGFALLYLAFTRQLSLLPKLHIPTSTAAFLAIAAPWHILASLRNPAIPMPPGLGLPAKAGWAWFYLYNEHIARFLQKRIPHDYGQTSIWLFWLFGVLWMMPWATFLPTALTTSSLRKPALSLFIWAGLILGFFTLSARQEYYQLPALPALALLIGGALAYADAQRTSAANRGILNWSLYFLVPLTAAVAAACAYFAVTAPAPPFGADLNHVLSTNPDLYNLSLGHMSDLTAGAMGFFRGPLITVAIGMTTLGLGSHLLRRRGQTLLANLVIAASMCGVLLAAHAGLARFYPILGSKDLALTIDRARKPGDLILIDGELTAGSTLLFYTGEPVHLVNGRVNGPWFGSFWPDAPRIFEDDASLHKLWASPQRLFLLTYDPTRRTADLKSSGPVITLASSGGKTVLTNK